MERKPVRLETARLWIRRFAEADRAAFAALVRDKMTAPDAIYDDQFPTDDGGVSALFAYILQTDAFFAVEEKKTGLLAGYVTLNPVDGESANLGYCILRARRGQGYATEAAAAAVRYAAEVLGLGRLVAGTALENTPSVRILQRLHFAETGRSVGSFARDQAGAPITFTGCAYELRFDGPADGLAKR